MQFRVDKITSAPPVLVNNVSNQNEFSTGWKYRTWVSESTD